MSEQNNLKKVLRLRDTVGLSVGQIIGSGIMALTGWAIYLTGTGAPLAFIIAAVFILVISMPIAVMGAALPTTGGQYAYASRLIGPKTGFYFVFLYNIGNVSIALYALSCAEYLSKIFPALHIRPAAFIVITFFYVINLLGVKEASRVENTLVLVKIVALCCFVFWGMPHVDLTVFNATEMLPGGMSGFFAAAAYGAFACMGATAVVELGGEMKNPKRDIPISIMLTTAVIGVFYGLIVTVASGVLPVEQVAGESLEAVAKSIFPSKFLYTFFIIGGPLFALSTSINALFAYTTKGLVVASDDGWMPKKLGEVNKKFGTPHWWLTIFYVLGAAPVVFGVSMQNVVNITLVFSFAATIIPAIAAWNLPKKYPLQYEKSTFKVSPGILKIFVVLSVALQVYLGYLIAIDLEMKYIIMGAVLSIAAIAYSFYIDNKKKISENMVDMFAEAEKEA